jgi:hypothetical protein
VWSQPRAGKEWEAKRGEDREEREEKKEKKEGITNEQEVNQSAA